ncbi:MAG: hypothetical protein LBE17_13270 [Treponema sp.]|jgi:hypothetical protein|nr:hypothetical protein [Treponema sp.]
MKKIRLFVFLGLTIVGLPLFAKGILDGGRDEVSQSKVADLVEVAEVQERDYEPRQNPGIQQAGGNVYALPASPLMPEAERLPPPVYAISGVKGQEIFEDRPLEAVDIVIALPERLTFSRGILEGEDVSNWIQNLPEGLEARAHGIKKGATSIKIYVSGTPAVTMREEIRVSIPGTYLTGGNARTFISPSEEESFRSWAAGQTQ